MAWRYGWFAERYGWTPNEVDAQPLWVLKQLPVWAGAWDEAQATLRIQAQEAAARKQAAAAAGR